MQRMITFIGVGLLVAVGAVLVVGNADVGQAQTQTPGVTEEIVIVERRTLTETVGSTGTVLAARTVNLTTGISGTVDTVMVDVGDRVSAGDVLVQLDTTDLEYQVRSRQDSLDTAQSNLNTLTAPPTDEEIANAEASVASAEVQLNNARASDQNSPLQIDQSCEQVTNAEETLADAQEAYDDYVTDGYSFDATFIPDPDSVAGQALDDAQRAYDNAFDQCTIAQNNAADPASITSAEANLRRAQITLDNLLAGPTEDDLVSARSQVTQAEINLEQAEENLANATLTAPFNGVVTAVTAVEGGYVGGTTVLVTIIDDSTLYIDVEVAELDVQQVDVGQSVEVTLQAFDDTAIGGSVDRIDPLGDDSSGIVTYTVRIALSDSARAPEISRPTLSGGLPSGGAPNPVALGLVRKIGGPQALQGILTSDDPVAALEDAIANVELTEDEQTLLDTVGGSAGLIETLQSFGGRQGGLGGQGGFDGENANPPAADDDTSTESAVELPPIRVGMTADVEIVVETLDDVLAVPSRAVRRDDSQTYLIVTNAANERIRVDVTVEQTVVGFSLISGDIEEGTQVLVPSLDTTAEETGGFGLFPGVGGGRLGGGGGNGGGN